MRAFPPAALAFVAIVGAALAGCPSRISPTAARPTPPPEVSPTPTPSSGWRPLPKPIPLAAGDVSCVSDKDCPRGTRCSSPEAASWNSCGAPRETDCGSGWTGDECGHCFLVCRNTDGCPRGMICNASKWCESLSRCVAVKPPVP